MGAFKDTGWEWDFRWRRPLFDREIDMAVAFLKDVESHRIQPHISDQWVWKADTSGHYSAKTAYQTLRKDISQENDDGAFGVKYTRFEYYLKSMLIPYYWSILTKQSDPNRSPYDFT